MRRTDVAGVALVALLVASTLLAVPPTAGAVYTCAGRDYVPTGSQLIVNGGYENDLSGWSVPGSVNSPTISSTVRHNGSKSARVDAVDGMGTLAYQTVSGMPSAYLLSYWFYVDTWGPVGHFAVELIRNWGAGTADFATRVYWFPPNTMKWDVWVPISGGGVTQTFAQTLTNGTWHLLETVVNGGTGEQCLYIDGALYSSASVLPSQTFLPDIALFGDISLAGDAGISYYDDLSVTRLSPPLPDYVPLNPQPIGVIRTGLSRPVSFSLDVWNGGVLGANATATVAFYNQSTPGSPFASSSIPPLLAGGIVGPFTASWMSPSIPGTYRVIADVDHSGDIAESDEANNYQAWTIEVYPPPITTLSLGTPSYNTYVTTATPLSLLATDRSGTGILRTAYRIDAGSWIDYAGPFTLIAEGCRVLEWYSEDNVGNVEAVESATLCADDTPPTTTLSLGLPVYNVTFITSATTLTLTASDGGLTPSGVESIQYRIDGGAWIGYGAPFALATEGAHTVEYQAADHLGNTEPIRSRPLTVDNTAPTTSLTVGSPSYGGTFVTSSTPLALASSDGGLAPVGVASVEYRIDGGAWQTYAGPFMLAGESVHLVEYRAADLLGNLEATRSRSLTVDNTSPSATVDVGNPSYTASETWVTSVTPITINAADGGAIPVGLSTTEYRVWTGTWTAWSPYATPFTLPPDGQRYVEWRASDRLGNAASGNRSLVVDDTPPTVQVGVSGPQYASGGTTWIASTSGVSLTATDGGALPVGVASLEFRLWFGSWGSWSPFVAAFTLAGEGRHYLEWRATDRLGNAGMGNVSLIVDDTPPESQAALSGPNVTVTQTFVTSATLIVLTTADGGVNPAGVSVLEFSSDGIRWTPYAVPFSLQGADGLHVLYYRGTDRVGNQEVARALSLVLDNTPPTTTLVVPVGPLSVGSRFSLEATDAGSGVASTEYSVDGGPWTGYTGPFALAVGNHEIRYRSTDRLGNREVQLTSVLVVENWKPMVAFLFTLLLALLGLILAMRSRKSPEDRTWIERYLMGSLPFVVAEAVTGMVSAMTGAMPIPPFLDLGMIVDVGIFVAGLAVATLINSRAGKAPVTPGS